MAAKGRLNPFGDSSKNFVFFPSLSHKKGVHRIVRGLESNCGLILLTGEIGIGKTSLARHIQSYLADRFVFVELGNPYQTPLEQVFYSCEQFGLDTVGLSSIHDCVGKLEKFFHTVLEGGKRPVIVFDESHLLTKRHLNLIHILSNLRAEDGPLVQILLVGQLEILDLLAMEGMEALNQRIGVRCELSPLVLEDTDKYINFKLEKSGKPGLMAFSPGAVERIWKESSGLPRLINHVCAHALDTLTFRDTNVVTPEMVDEVCRDSVYTGMFQAKTNKDAERNSRPWLIGGGVLAGLVLAVVVWLALSLSWNAPIEQVVKQPVAPVKKIPAAETSDAGAEAGPVLWEHKERVSATQDPPAKQIPVDSVPADDEAASEVVVVVEEPSAGGESEGEQAEALEIRTNPTSEGIPSPGEVPDGSSHPVIGQLVIGAIAWNDDASARVAVINSNLVHEGELIDDVTVLNIGQDYILFEYDGEYYKLTFSR